MEIAPVFGGKLVSVDTAAAEKMPGVKRVVRLEEAVAVVADTYWRARVGAGHAQAAIRRCGSRRRVEATIFEAFDKSLGAPPDMPADAATVIKADYKIPFLPHATMEPMACTARVTGDRAEVWAGTQDPLNARKTAADALGFSPEQVQYTNLALGGGFGRKLPGYLDFVGMSARIAKAMSPAPVKMIWSRENDMQHGYYRPAGDGAVRRRARRESGAPLAVRSSYAGGGDGESVFMPYAIADKKFSARDAKHPIRTGPWRSVLNSQHGFFKESFIDEMAHAAGKDPFHFRRDLMTEHPRFKAVLERVAAMAGWGQPLPARRGRGIAIAESFGIHRRRSGARVGVAGRRAQGDAGLRGRGLRRCREYRYRHGAGRRRDHVRTVGGAAGRDHHCERQGRRKQLQRLSDHHSGGRAARSTWIS